MFRDLEFTAADLEGNRSGGLTDKQRQLVDEVYQYRQQQGRKTVVAFLIFFATLMIVGGLIEFGQSKKSFQAFLVTEAGVFLMVCGLFALILAISGVFTYIISLDAKRHRISVAEGQATIFNGLRWYRGSSYPSYELTLRRGFSKTKFRFPNASSLRYFETGKHYRLYYVKYYPFPLPLSAEAAK